MTIPFARDGRGPKAIPGYLKSALTKQKLYDTFLARPDYQRAEYLTWLENAKVSERRQQRLTQLIDELTRGDVYMGAPWSPPAPVKQ
jgi:uncharacterized protein YdeI (YjbR/CyaY-like superfamily)